MLRALGVGRIVGVDASAFRRRMALDLGVVEAVDADALEAAAARAAGSGPRGKHAGADVVIEASGAAVLLSGATRLLRSGGRIVMVALHKADASLDVNDIVGREIDVVGCFGYDDEFAETLDLLSHNAIDAERLVTQIFSLEEATAAFAAQADLERHVKEHISPHLQ
jgi:threonine dehydrogenase-like Zn-dependent dehydrogenase